MHSTRASRMLPDRAALIGLVVLAMATGLAGCGRRPPATVPAGSGTAGTLLWSTTLPARATALGVNARGTLIWVATCSTTGAELNPHRSRQNSV
ncbi:MAG: hypothetical protein ACYCXA_05165 [Actinomycetes bacterium]